MSISSHREQECTFNNLHTEPHHTDYHWTTACTVCGVTFEQWVAQEFGRLRVAIETLTELAGAPDRIQLARRAQSGTMDPPPTQTPD